MLRRSVLSLCSRSKSSSSLAFSDSEFDSSSYSAYRPTYGTSLYKQLYEYHEGDYGVALDLGCGTGQVSVVLADQFETVHGMDTSVKMLNQASRKPNIQYRQGTAEATSLSDESVDLVTVGQAAHWFNHALWFKEMARILKRDGTLSFWSYNEAVFSDSRNATRVLNRFFRSSEKLGSYWPQPGRRILESAMDGVAPPEALFKQIERYYTAQRDNDDVSPVRKSMPLKYAESYVRTSSAYHNWKTAHPNIEEGRGDIVDDMMAEIKACTAWNDETVINIHWPTIAVLARKS